MNNAKHISLKIILCKYRGIYEMQDIFLIFQTLLNNFQLIYLLTVLANISFNNLKLNNADSIPMLPEAVF